MADKARNKQINIKCHNCGNIYSFNVNEQDFRNWQAGEHAQNALPYLTVVERELLISQTCGECWEKMFPGEEP